jgi:hypothetical protein
VTISGDEGDEELDDPTEIDYGDLVAQLELVLECYIIGEYCHSISPLIRVAIPRLPNTKSTSTLLPLSSALTPALTSLTTYSTPSSSRNLLYKLCELIRVIIDWVQTTSDRGGEQKVSYSFNPVETS